MEGEFKYRPGMFTILGIYLAMVLFCVLLIGSGMGDIKHGTIFNIPAAVESGQRIVALASDAFKFVLGAAMGALSIVAQQVMKERPG